MHIVITGGAGFLGVRLARTLLAQGQLALAGAAPAAITRITLVDRAPPPADLLTDTRVAEPLQLAEQARRERITREHPATHMVAGPDNVARWLCAECAGPGAIALPAGSVAPCAEHLSQSEPTP